MALNTNSIFWFFCSCLLLELCSVADSGNLRVTKSWQIGNTCQNFNFSIHLPNLVSNLTYQISQFCTMHSGSQNWQLCFIQKMIIQPPYMLTGGSLMWILAFFYQCWQLYSQVFFLAIMHNMAFRSAKFGNCIHKKVSLERCVSWLGKTF